MSHIAPLRAAQSRNDPSRQDGAASLVTAAQVEEDCPFEVEALGYRIAAHLQKARDYEAKAREKAGVELRKADDNWNTVTQLLAEAKAKCSAGGFKAFQEKYCPNLGRSRIYELLEIGSGKKTLVESRAAKRERVAKSRSRVSATVGVADKAGNNTVPPAPPVSPVPIKAAVDTAPEAKPALPVTIPAKATELNSEIEREWRKARDALKTLQCQYTPVQVAKVILSKDARLVIDLAGFFAELKARLNGEVPDCSIPHDDLSIPAFLQRGDDHAR